MNGLFNLARVTTPTTGTGPITLGPAVTGYLTFDEAGAPDGATVSYGIFDHANSEAGWGVYNAGAGTLTRNVYRSSGAANVGLIDLSGTAQVFITALAEDFDTFLTGNEAITLSGDISGSGTTSIVTALPNVNSNVGTFQGITTNAKGLVTAASDQGYLTAASAASIYLPLSGGTLTGALVLAGAPTTNLHAATKLYVDTADALKLNLTGGTLSGPLGVNTTIPADRSGASLYAGPVTLTHVATNLYLNAANTNWLRQSGTGSGGIIHYDPAGNVFNFFTAPSGTINTTATLTNQMTLTNGGVLTAAASIITGSGPVWSRGATAALIWRQQDNAGIDWQWYSIAGIARLWLTGVGDVFTVTNAGLTTAAGIIRSEGAATNNGLVTYDTTYGYAGALIQYSSNLYIAKTNAAGGITANYAYFNAADLTMTMGGYGIRYGNAYGGTSNAFAFGWANYPGFGGNASITIDNGGAWYPIANASDARLKTDVVPSTLDALEVINRIPLREYRWIDIETPTKLREARADIRRSGPLKRIGVVAQEVAEVFPDGVVYGDDFDDRLGAVWTLDTNNMIAALIGSVQQLTARVAALGG